MPPREAFDTVCRLCAKSGKSLGHDSSDSATSSSTSDQDQWELDPLVIGQKIVASTQAGVPGGTQMDSRAQNRLSFLFSSGEVFLVFFCERALVVGLAWLVSVPRALPSWLGPWFGLLAELVLVRSVLFGGCVAPIEVRACRIARLEASERIGLVPAR